MFLGDGHVGAGLNRADEEEGNYHSGLSDIMTRDVLTARRDDTLLEIARKMHEGRAGSVVVVDESGKPLGIVTERDVVYACAKGLSATVPAWSVMTGGPRLNG
jgi:FOG: CBS domain